MRYKNLSNDAEYKMRVVYAGNNPNARLRLIANNGVEIHPLLAKPAPVHPIEFVIPKEATHDGELTLSWTQEPGKGASGRGCQVAEVWLMRR